MDYYVSVVMEFPSWVRSTGQATPQGELLRLVKVGRLEDIICAVRGVTPVFQRGDHLNPKVAADLGCQPADAVITIPCTSDGRNPEDKASNIASLLISKGFRAIAWREEINVITRPPDEMPRRYGSTGED